MAPAYVCHVTKVIATAQSRGEWFRAFMWLKVVN